MPHRMAITKSCLIIVRAAAPKPRVDAILRKPWAVMSSNSRVWHSSVWEWESRVAVGCDWMDFAKLLRNWMSEPPPLAAGRDLPTAPSLLRLRLRPPPLAAGRNLPTAPSLLRLRLRLRGADGVDMAESASGVGALKSL